MVYVLKRLIDGENNSGTLSKAIWENAEGIFVKENARPELNVCLRVGTEKKRSFIEKDWIQTSYIKEIIEEEENKVLFKTEDYVYEWKKILD